MAEYTTIDDLDLRAVSRDYGLTNASVTVLRGGAANSSFAVRSDSGEYVLTVLDNHDSATARRLVDVTQSLFRLGVPTTRIVPTVAGRPAIEINERPAILKRWIAGTVCDHVPVDLLWAAGAALGGLHSVRTDITALPSRTRRLSPEQEAEIERFSDREFATWLATRLGRVRAAHGTLPDAVTHGDLFPDNLIVRPDRSLAIIDWETASLDDPLLDLGMAVVGLARVDDRVVEEYASRIIAGYRSVRPLTDADLTVLPSLVEYAALVIAFHRYHRHNVRFPNPEHADSYRRIVRLVESMAPIRA